MRVNLIRLQISEVERLQMMRLGRNSYLGTYRTYPATQYWSTPNTLGTTGPNFPELASNYDAVAIYEKRLYELRAQLVIWQARLDAMRSTW